MFHSNNSLAREIENLELCKQFSVEGILLSVSYETSSVQHLLDIAKQIPIVQFDRVIPNTKIPSITINDWQVAYEATEILLQRGHQYIVGLFGIPNLYISKEREKGVRAALQAHSIAPKDELLLGGTTAEVVKQLDALLQSAMRPTAIFAMSDDLLVSIYHLLLKNQLRVPDDISIICISEGKSPNFFFPKVTYIRHSGEEIAQRASEMLFQLIQADRLIPTNQTVPFKLVLQDSI